MRITFENISYLSGEKQGGMQYLCMQIVIHAVYYKFEKVGDSIECIFGGRLREDYDRFSEATGYYVGFLPMMASDVDQFNPAIDKRCVALKDMPKNS